MQLVSQNSFSGHMVTWLLIWVYDIYIYTLKFNIVGNLEVLGGIKDLNLQSGRTQAPWLLPLLRFLACRRSDFRSARNYRKQEFFQHPGVKMKHAIVVFSHFKNTAQDCTEMPHPAHSHWKNRLQTTWVIQGWGDLDIIQSIQQGLKGRWADDGNKSQTSASHAPPGSVDV